MARLSTLRWEIADFQPLPTNDLWIAASCLEQGAALLTLDAHFQNIDGLRVDVRLEDFIP